MVDVWANASPYDTESYLNSLRISRGDVDRQVGNALQEITRRQQLAQQRVGQARGESGRVFDAAGQDYSGSMGQMQDNLGQYGGLFGNLSAYDQSGFNNALGTMRGGFQEALGLMGQGFDEQAQQRTTAAQRIRESLFSDIDRQRTDYISRREAEDRAAEEARAAAERQRQHEIAMQNAQLAAMGGGGGGGPSLQDIMNLMQPAGDPRALAQKLAANVARMTHLGTQAASRQAQARSRNNSSYLVSGHSGVRSPAANAQTFNAEQMSSAIAAGMDPYAWVQNPDGSWSVREGPATQPNLAWLVS